MSAHDPPPLLEGLLRRVLPEDALGDLAEGFRRRAAKDGIPTARWWYRREAFRFLIRWPLAAHAHPSPATRLDMMGQDLRFALRTMARRPGFTGVILLTLALGVGANTTIFSLVNAVFLRPLPAVERPERVVELYGSGGPDQDAGSFSGYLPLSWPNLRDVRDQSATLDGLYAYTIWPTSLVSESTAERVFTAFVTSNYFDVLGARPGLGRGFAPEEGVAGGGSPVAVLSHGFWTQRFGADPDILGRTLTLNTRTYTVVGVAPEGFRGTSSLFGPDLWVPLPMIQDVPVWGAYRENRAVRMFFAGARLAEERSLQSATAELDGIGATLADTYPDEVRERTIVPVPLEEAAVTPNIRGSLLGASAVLLVMVGLLLVIACINVANLLLARALGRRREMAIRTSVGAGRGRLAAQLATESLLLFGLGGGLGLIFSMQVQRLLSGWEMPLFFGFGVSLDLGLEARVLAFTAAITLMCALVFGLLPAWRTSRSDVASELRDGDARSGSARARVLRGGLVVAQVALSLVALVGAGLFARSLQESRAIDPGFDPVGLALVSVDLGAQRYSEDEGRDFYLRAVEEIEALPGIESAAVGEYRPLTPSGLTRVLRQGESDDEQEAGHLSRVSSVSSSYFETMGIPISRGRGLQPSDDGGGPQVAVVNQRMADLLWPGEDPLGRRLRVSLEEGVVEVVGVVPTGKYGDLTEDPLAALYRPLPQRDPASATLFVRGDEDVPGTLPAVRRTVQSLDPSLPLFDVEPAEALLDRALWSARAIALLLGGFGLVGMLLATLGIYGVVSMSVRERTREVGLRIALGSSARDVLGLVLGRILALAVLGSIIGLAGAALLTRSVDAMLVGVDASDPLVFGSVVLLLMGVAAAAAWVPARRATRVDPVVALRSD